MPQDSEAVITRSLPRFDARATAKRPEPGIRLIDSVRASRTPLPVASDDSGKEMPFRKLERPPAGMPRSPQRGVTGSRGLSAGAAGDGSREVPLQPRGRSGAVPPPGRSGLLGTADGDGKPLRGAPRSLGLNLEKEGGAVPDRGTTGPQERGKPASPDQASGPEEKRRRHAVEQLFRGSRQRPAPMTVDDDSRPEKQKANPPAAQGRSTGGRESGERVKPSRGRGESAGERPSEPDKSTARSSSGRAESGSKNSSGRQDGAAKQDPEREGGKSASSPGGRKERPNSSSGRGENANRGR
jgi:hypothetical protein